MNIEMNYQALSLCEHNGIYTLHFRLDFGSLRKKVYLKELTYILIEIFDYLCQGIDENPTYPT